MRLSRTLLAVSTLLMAAHAHADQEFSGTGTQSSHECETAEQITVSGVGQNITLAGACGALRVSGTGNNVNIAQVEAIEVVGTSNVLRFGSNAAGGKPRLKNVGMGNSVVADSKLRSVSVPAEMPASSAHQSTPATLLADSEQCDPTQTVQGVANGQSLQCDAGERLLIEGFGISTNVSGDCAAICVNGTKNVITVDGDALAVAISGTGNQIRAKRVDAVSVEGMNNSIRYQSSMGGEGPKKDQPKVAREGVGNSVVRE